MKYIIPFLFFLTVIVHAQPGPVQVQAATQAEVNDGLISNKYVSPKTLNNWSGGGGGGGGSPGGSVGDWQYKSGASTFGGLTPAAGWNTWFLDPSYTNLNALLTGDDVSGLAATNTFTGSNRFSGNPLLLGTAGSAVGSLSLFNATSGSITITPPTGALGTITLTPQAITGTIYSSGGTDVVVADGGTGASSLTGILQGNGTSAVTGITNSTTVGQIFRVTGSNTYGWGALDLADTDAVTNNLPLTNTGATTGDVVKPAGSAATTTPHSVSFTVTGAGTPLAIGVQDLIVNSKFGGTLVGVSCTISPADTITWDILRSADGGAAPSASIVGGSGTKPSISTGVNSHTTNFTSWTSTTLNAFDNYKFQITAVGGVGTVATITLNFQ